MRFTSRGAGELMQFRSAPRPPNRVDAPRYEWRRLRLISGRTWRRSRPNGTHGAVTNAAASHAAPVGRPSARSPPARR
jgi:hypothetical protein